MSLNEGQLRQQLLQQLKSNQLRSQLLEQLKQRRTAEAPSFRMGGSLVTDLSATTVSSQMGCSLGEDLSVTMTSLQNKKRASDEKWETNTKKKLRSQQVDVQVIHTEETNRPFALSPFVKHNGRITIWNNPGEEVVNDFRNVYHYECGNLRVPFTPENAIKSLEGLFDDYRIKKYHIVLTDVLGEEACDRVAMKIINEASKYGKKATIYSYVGDLRNGDDLLCIQLSQQFRCNIITNDRMNKSEDKLEEGQIIQFRIIASTEDLEMTFSI